MKTFELSDVDFLNILRLLRAKANDERMRATLLLSSTSLRRGGYDPNVEMARAWLADAEEIDTLANGLETAERGALARDTNEVVT